MAATNFPALTHPSLAAMRDAVLRRADRPEVALVLGSGLSFLAGRVADAVVIPYNEIEGFLRTGIPGHAGRLVLGRLGGRRAAVFAGRAHYYEGRSLAEVTLTAQLAWALGARAIVLTNAAGALNPGFRTGDLVLIEDHINLMGTNPLLEALRSSSERTFSEPPSPFVNLDGLYEIAFHDRLAADLAASGTVLRRGTLAAVSGPAYETPAERRMLRGLGADMVCMSTVPEAIMARYLSLRVAALSLITNAEGVGGHSVTHHGVLEAAQRSAESFAGAVTRLLELFP